MNVNTNLILWIQISFPKRMQYVYFNGTMSDAVETDTDAPHGCVKDLII